MSLDEIRVMAQHRKEELIKDPNTPQRRIDLADKIIKMFSNVDYLKEAPKSLIHQSLLFIGYEFEQIRPLYDALMKEIHATYKAVSPEQLAEVVTDRNS